MAKKMRSVLRSDDGSRVFPDEYVRECSFCGERWVINQVYQAGREKVWKCPKCVAGEEVPLEYDKNGSLTIGSCIRVALSQPLAGIDPWPEDDKEERA